MTRDQRWFCCEGKGFVMKTRYLLIVAVALLLVFSLASASVTPAPSIQTLPGLVDAELGLGQMDERANPEPYSLNWTCHSTWTWIRWLNEPNYRPLR